jgi:soluble lytic murein transglycosylase
VARLGAPELVLFLANRFVLADRAATAESLYERVSDDFRKSGASVAAFRRYLSLLEARGVASDATLQLQGAELAEASGSWRSALNFARAARASASTRAESDQARRVEGIALYNLGEYDEAFSLLKDLRADDPGPAIERDALLTMARAERRRGRDDESEKLYERFVDEFPSDSFVEEVLWDQAWEHRRAGDIKYALELFHQIANRSPRGKRADEALFHEALMHAWRGDSEEAASDLERLTARSPSAALGAQTLFFRMRLARDAGRDALTVRLRDSLDTHYRDTFYAVYQELEESGPERPWHSASGDARSLGPFIAAMYDADREETAAREWSGISGETEEGLTERGARSLRRAERLIAAGLDDLAEAEIANVDRPGALTPWQSFLLARACRRLALHHAALSAGSRFAESRPGRRPPEVARFLFPAAYADFAASAAADFDLDPRFLLAIAREESWFDADVVSAAGAVGLSQLMPSTAERVATRLGDPRLLANGLTNPAANLRVGAAYFSGLTREFNGSPMLAAAGYNAGENAVEKWRPYYAPDDVPRFIESISYTETRGYVKKILRSFWMYRSLYPMESESRERATQ